MSEKHGQLLGRLLGRLKRQPAIAGAATLVGSSAWVLSTNWGPIAAGHPSYLVVYGAFLATGVWILRKGLRSQSGPGRPWVSFAGTLVLLLTSVLALWLSPFGAEATALAVLQEPDDLTVTETATVIVMELESADPETGVIFHPGARVDARAYLNTLRPLAKSGYRIVVVKEPLGIAFLSFGFTQSWIERDDDIRSWILAGHSLGGVVASSEAVSDHIAGLLLWASYPAGDVSNAEWLEVGSIYGTADQISEPAQIEESAALLPENTTFIPIRGGIHSHFGDYGTQPGDGEPGVDRSTAQAEIAKASLALLHVVESSHRDRTRG